MRTNAITIQTIDRESFLRYGETVEVVHPDPGRAQRGEDDYRTLSRSVSNGWKVAMHCVRTRGVESLHSYDSRRLLSPLSGTALLCAAPPERPENVQLFLLDCAVTLNPGIPHCLIALSAEAWVQVTEN